MILVIDGYNLLKSIFYGDISDKVRQEFINRLNRYAKKKNHNIYVIFDGGNFTFPSKYKSSLINIIYAGYNHSADEVIKNFIEENRYKELILISSDRELRNFAKDISIESIASKEFYNLILDAETPEILGTSKSDNILYKTSISENDDLDTIMQEAAKGIMNEKEESIKSDKIKRNELSKKDKKLVKKIKKL